MIVQKHNQRGFTLVELLIATSIFSVVMVVSLYSFIQIGRYYTKAIYTIRTQDAARNLEADVATQMQMTTGKYQISNMPSTYYDGTYKAVCISNKAYVYKLNTVEDGSGKAIVSYIVAPDTCRVIDYGSKEVLLGKGTRLLDFKISPYPDADVGPLFEITVALLYEPDQAATGLPSLVSGTVTDTTTWKCKSNVKGSEYCALARISTTVYKRIM